MIKGIARFPSIIIYSLSFFSFLLEVTCNAGVAMPIKQENEVTCNTSFFFYSITCFVQLVGFTAFLRIPFLKKYI
jgi:hypothetical protein